MEEELMQIFTENLLSRLVTSPASSVTLEAKYYFGQNVQTDLGIAFLGILCAFFINYYLGRLLGSFEKYFNQTTKDLFAKAKRIMQGRGRVVLLLAFLPFGNLLPLAAGVLNISCKKVAPFITIAAASALLKFIL